MQLESFGKQALRGKLHPPWSSFVATAGVSRGSMASTAPPGGPHSNIFVRGLPLGWTEADITTVFQQYGALTSIRLVRHSVTKHSLG